MADKTKKKAAVWEFFGRKQQTEAKLQCTCKLCCVELTYNAAGSTSSMRKHLEFKHPSISKDKVSKGKALVQPVIDLFHQPINEEKYERITKSTALICAENVRIL